LQILALDIVDGTGRCLVLKRHTVSETPNYGLCFYLKSVFLKVKQSRYTPYRRLRGEEVYLLLIHDLGTRWR
jgi:hypothetical protein